MANRRLRWWYHGFFTALKYVGLRDRLRCPECHAVGTWKPHGGPLDREDLKKLKRWLCKWCGHYEGPEGTMTCYVDSTRREWSLPKDTPERLTPQIALGERMPSWPWRG